MGRFTKKYWHIIGYDLHRYAHFNIWKPDLIFDYINDRFHDYCRLNRVNVLLGHST